MRTRPAPSQRRGGSSTPWPARAPPRPPTAPASATARALRRLARRHRILTDEIADIDTELRAPTARAAPTMLATKALRRQPPPPCSSPPATTPAESAPRPPSPPCAAPPRSPPAPGKTNRHRLNRGGDRQANWALHQIALVRLSSDPRTKAYAARLTATGKNCKEILRRPRTRHRPRSMAPADPPPTRTPHRRPAPTAPRTRTHPHPSRPPPEHPPGPDQRTRTRHTPRHHPHRSIPPMAQHPTTTDPHRLTPIGASTGVAAGPAGRAGAGRGRRDPGRESARPWPPRRAGAVAAVAGDAAGARRPPRRAGVVHIPAQGPGRRIVSPHE